MKFFPLWIMSVGTLSLLLGCSDSAPNPEAKSSGNVIVAEAEKPLPPLANDPDWLKPRNISNQNTNTPAIRPARPTRPRVNTNNNTTTRPAPDASSGPSSTGTPTTGQVDPALEGQWYCVKSLFGGSNAEHMKGMIILIDKNQLNMKTKDGDLLWQLMLDPTANPKTINMIANQQGKRMELHGLYRIDGENLEINLGGPGEPRPADFSGQETILLCQREPVVVPKEPEFPRARDVAIHLETADQAFRTYLEGSMHQDWEAAIMAVLPEFRENVLMAQFYNVDTFEGGAEFDSEQIFKAKKELFAKYNINPGEFLFGNRGRNKVKAVEDKVACYVDVKNWLAKFGYLGDYNNLRDMAKSRIEPGETTTIYYYNSIRKSEGKETKVPAAVVFELKDGKWGLDPFKGQKLSHELGKEAREESLSSVDGGIKLRKKLELGEGEIYSLSISPDGSQLAIGTKDLPPQIWDLEKLERTAEFNFPAREEYLEKHYAVSWSPDGKKLAVSMNRELCILTVETNQWEPIAKAYNPEKAHPTEMLWVGEDRLLMVLEGSDANQISLIEIPSGKILFNQPVTETRNPHITLSPDQKTFAFTALNTVTFIDLNTMQPKGEVLTVGTDPDERLGALAYSPDGKSFATSQDQSNYVWERTGEGVRNPIEIRGEDFYNSSKLLAFSSDSSQLIVATYVLNVIDLKERKFVVNVELTGNTSSALSPNRKTLVTGVESGKVFVWDLEIVQGAEIAPASDSTVSTETAEPPAVEFRTWKSADGKFTVEAKMKSSDGTMVSLEKKEGGVSKVPIDKLSEEDQQYIKNH